MLRYNEQLYQGMDVYDANDEKIGTVDEILDAAAGGASPSGGGYLRVPTGFLGMGREHHIPFSAIRSVEGERVYVNFPKHRLDELGYGEPPTSVDRRVSSAARPDSPEATRRLQLREEELVARKQSVETGRVRLGKEIVAEERTLEVPVTREEVTIERRPVERRPSDKPIEETSRTIEVPVRAEQVKVEKQPVVYEEVGVRKDQVTQTKSVSSNVRREEARIERTGDVSVGGAPASTSRTWERAMPRYRERWQTRYGTAASRWEDVEPMYRYGHELRSRTEYRGRRWDELEPEFRRDWEQRYPNTPWDRAREAIRDAWEDATS